MYKYMYVYINTHINRICPELCETNLFKWPVPKFTDDFIFPPRHYTKTCHLCGMCISIAPPAQPTPLSTRTIDRYVHLASSRVLMRPARSPSIVLRRLIAFYDRCTCMCVCVCAWPMTCAALTRFIGIRVLCVHYTARRAADPNVSMLAKRCIRALSHHKYKLSFARFCGARWCWWWW